MKKMKASTLRMLAVLAVLLISAVGYFAAICLGNLSAFGWDAFSVLCPLGYLESLLASQTFVPRALISFLAGLVFIVVLGRVFCAWLCPMPILQRWFPGFKGRGASHSRKEDVIESARQSGEGIEDPAIRTPAQPNRFKIDSRYGVLLGALASAAIFGFPVFCLICPVGLTFATVFLIMRLFAFGDMTWTVIVVPLVLLAEVLFARKWCKKICPLGAFISLVSGANKTLRPTIDDRTCLCTSKGVNCIACAKACPEDIDIRRTGLSKAPLNNCTKCRECAEACPTQAITFPFLSPTRASTKSVSGQVVQGTDEADRLE